MCYYVINLKRQIHTTIFKRIKALSLLKIFFFGTFILAARPFELRPAKSFGLRLVYRFTGTGFREMFITIDNELLCYKLEATEQYTAMLKV